MDCRITLANNETFMALLNQAYATGEKVAMIIDDNGLERMEGFLTGVNATAPVPFIEMEDGSKVDLAKIVAINGIFFAGLWGVLAELTEDLIISQYRKWKELISTLISKEDTEIVIHRSFPVRFM